MMRKLIIGDIRGDLGLLKKLFDKLQPDERDFVLFLGAYIGPGPDSKGTVDFLLEQKAKFPNTFHFLSGCYERLFKNLLITQGKDQGLSDFWRRSGGVKILSSYNGGVLKWADVGTGVQRIRMEIAIPEPHIKFIEGGTFLYYKDADLPFMACHAGVHPERHEEMKPEDVLFLAADWWKGDWRLPGLDVVFGHTSFVAPLVKPGKIGIDLGCGLGGSLCAVEMFTKQFTVVS